VYLLLLLHFADTASLPGTATYTELRDATYQRMAADLAQHALQLGGIITQGLTQKDLFSISSQKAGHLDVQPVLKPLDVPVRAVILPVLQQEAAAQIHAAAASILGSILDSSSIWWQDPQIYHATVYHASTHMVSAGVAGSLRVAGADVRLTCTQAALHPSNHALCMLHATKLDPTLYIGATLAVCLTWFPSCGVALRQAPVPATASEVEVESEAIRGVASQTCPIAAVLDRVILTSSGVLVACWQVGQQMTHHEQEWHNHA
jgi:hypothetical protein